MCDVLKGTCSFSLMFIFLELVWKILSHPNVISPEFSLVSLKNIFNENAKGHICTQPL